MQPAKYFESLIEVMNKTDMVAIESAVEIIKNYIENDRWIFTCGNGGSASTASHYVTDWGKMRLVNKGKTFKAMCLTDNIGMLTAYGNDISYSDVFNHSLKNYASKDDLVIFVSGSGNSRNIIEACHTANEIGMTTLCVVGYDGGQIAEMCEHVVHFPSFDMQLCEDLHLCFGHIVMKALCE